MKKITWIVIVVSLILVGALIIWWVCFPNKPTAEIEADSKPPAQVVPSIEAPLISVQSGAEGSKAENKTERKLPIEPSTSTPIPNEPTAEIEADSKPPAQVVPSIEVPLVSGQSGAEGSKAESKTERKLPIEPSTSTPISNDLTSAVKTSFTGTSWSSRPDTWIVLTVSLVTNFFVILTLFYQLRWRKHIVRGERVLMPEQWVNGLAANLSSLNTSLGELGEMSRNNYKRLSELSDISATLNLVIDEKDEQIRRFRKGYDEHVYIQFLSKFINITEAVMRLSQKDKITADDVENIHFRLSDALEDCNVAVKTVEIGSIYADLGNQVEDNPKTINTDDKGLAFTVAEVLRPAYIVSTAEGSQVVLPAKVAIYVNEAGGT